MSERESLFSLEVIVDQLILPSVTCRFPAIAFRLLDFPTLLVQHVEPELSDRIKKKISIELQANLPRQLRELQDKNGAFLVKRGKSCLFKIPPETLRVHLSNTPLYVLVIDTFPSTPKLVASCLIPLNDCMGKIHADIERLGVAVPHVHGEKGQYKLYNLMGIEVGHVDIACRLLSLGEGLMQHIPDHAIAKFGGTIPSESPLNESPRKSKPSTLKKATDGSQIAEGQRKTPRQVVIQAPIETDRDLIVEDLEAPERSQPIIISSAKDDTSQKESSGTQTELQRKPKHVKFPVSDLADELDNIYLTNTYCPPPLFYNSGAEEKLPPTKIEVYEYQSRPADPLIGKDFDTESVRSDDALFDVVEQGLDQTQIKPYKPKFIHTQYSLKPPNPEQPDLQQMLTSPDFQGGQFPLLRALTVELAFLQNQGQQHQGQPQKSGATNQKSSAEAVSIHKSPRTPRTPREVHKGFPVLAEKENREEFLTRIAAPKRKFPEKQGVVPSNKGWLRKGPLYGQRKTKPQFSYGMTNTQRLRLAQVNPDLLLSLETEQEELKKKKQAENMKNMTNVQKAMAGTFVLKPGVEMRGEVTVDSHVKNLGKPHKRPVPTPRRVSIDDNASIRQVSPSELIYEARLAEAQQPIDHPDTPKLGQVAEDHEGSTESSQHAGSQRSIEVRVPGVTMNETSASYSTDSESPPPSEASVERQPVKGRKEPTDKKPPKYGEARSTFPGFPAAFQPNDTQKTESTLHYTDEFEDSKQWMSTDEPELQALGYSESEGDRSDSHTPTEEQDDSAVRASTTIRIPIVNPKASLNSPKAAIKKPSSFRGADSTARTIEGDTSSDKGSLSPTPKPRKSITPPSDTSPQRLKLQRSVSFEFDDEEPTKDIGLHQYSRKGGQSDLGSSVEEHKPIPHRRSNVGPSPSADSASLGSPTRQRKHRPKSKLESIHTESVSSYVPSDMDNLNLNASDVSDEYSDDFDLSDGYQPSYIPASQARVAKGAGRLGYTWN